MIRIYMKRLSDVCLCVRNSYISKPAITNGEQLLNNIVLRNTATLTGAQQRRRAAHKGDRPHGDAARQRQGAAGQQKARQRRQNQGRDKEGSGGATTKAEPPSATQTMPPRRSPYWLMRKD